ncbi:hypothetical protein GCM10010116_57630 [Microbispora rosea subsp. aerata]|nr:hypothetical protein [Microbispora rosea]GGO28743.1 hypothetical protein GCM10010116_57630 [Microbispora rosea subsp. aerata]GIH58767.1 hypothetical protein Mro02_56810 [Microbispora rosea subsp. aerata]GLJ85354.1 hypothetical protein GCM10017588_40850 [Microbispora rosea subsp. aerata]
MTVIVGVHGIGKYHYYEEAGGSAGGAAEAMRAKWNAYLHQGLTGQAEGTGDYFTEIAYYAHHLCGGPPKAPRQMAAPAKLVLADWAVQLGGPFREAAGESLTGLAHRLAEWLLDRLGPQAVRFAQDFCPEVAAYLGGGDPRARARDAVADVVRRRRPRVVVAHSLGSVVTYEALWAHPDLSVELLVTLGSPLGMRDVVFDRLAPAPVRGRGARPPGVRRWINIADKDDIAAIPAVLSSCFDGVERDVSCDIDWLDFHTVRNYLRCESVREFLEPYLT